ncbi:MAG: pilus assembly protein TadG-related protein [Gammaproteobacteria bacterium]
MSLWRRQQGQAAVFVYVFLAVLVVAMAFLYKAGKLTSDKMELQNAADAVAYSVSVIEARDLNFAAYMNRAIIANEVSIGQMVGLASWAYHWRSFDDYLRAYATPLKPTPLAPLAGALEAMGKFFRISGDKFIVPFMTKLADKPVTSVHFFNQGYGWAEYIFHMTSTVYALGAVSEMIDQNAPDGARLSEYGLLSLIGHLATYGALPKLPGKKFTHNYDPTTRVKKAAINSDIAGNTDAGGYARLAALVYDSGDIFTKARGWDFDLFKELHNAGVLPDLGPIKYSEDSDGDGWYGLDTGQHFYFGVAEVAWRMYLQIHMKLAREGGGELRLVVPLNGTDKGKAAGQFFNWSAADTTNLGLGLRGGFSVKAWIVIPIVKKRIKILDIGADLVAKNDRIKAGATILGKKLTIIDKPLPTKFPFGAGFAQAGKNKKKLNNFLASKKPHMGSIKSAALKGPVPKDAYGSSANNLLAWEFPLPPGIFFQAGMGKRQVNKNYAGLPRYTDTVLDPGVNNQRPLHGSGGPQIVIGVTLDEAAFDRSSDGKNPETEPGGRFQLTEKLGAGQLDVLAKSEVYFKRPTDLSYFARGDGQQEAGSAFNPYWQAHLVETSHADRTAAVLLQQGADVEGGGAPYALSSLLGPMITLFGF